MLWRKRSQKFTETTVVLPKLVTAYKTWLYNRLNNQHSFLSLTTSLGSSSGHTPSLAFHKFRPLKGSAVTPCTQGVQPSVFTSQKSSHCQIEVLSVDPLSVPALIYRHWEWLQWLARRPVLSPHPLYGPGHGFNPNPLHPSSTGKTLFCLSC